MQNLEEVTEVEEGRVISLAWVLEIAVFAKRNGASRGGNVMDPRL